MNWKHQSTGEVISNHDYEKLSHWRKSDYTQTSESPTHRHSVEDTTDSDDDGFLSTAIGLGIALSSSGSDSGSSGSGGSDFGGFGGGSFGGGGASSDF